MGNRYKELEGVRFGRLTALYPLKRRDQRGCVYWRCRCDCGEEAEVSENNLVQGISRSCGCLKRECQQRIAQKLHCVDGTCLEILEKRKHRKDNLSGFRGVFKTKSGKYRVDIGFKGRKYYVGTYILFEEAVRARKKAEEAVHEGFLRAYGEWKEKAEHDPVWGKEHPLVFEVKREDGRLIVRRGETE